MVATLGDMLDGASPKHFMEPPPDFGADVEIRLARLQS